MEEKINKPETTDCWEWITPELFRAWSSERLKSSMSQLTKAINRVTQDANILIEQLEKKDEEDVG